MNLKKGFIESVSRKTGQPRSVQSYPINGHANRKLAARKCTLWCCRTLLILTPLTLCTTAIQAEGANPAAAQAAQSLRSTAEPGRIGEELSTPPAQSEPNTINEGELRLPSGQKLAPEIAAIKFQLNEIKILNPVVFSCEELLCPYYDYFGKTITLGELQTIAEKMTTFYQKEGYVLTKVIIPQQHIKEGIATLQVIAGHIDAIRITGKSCPDMDEVLEAYGECIRACKPLNIKILERYTLLANDLPGWKVSSVLKPSKTTVGAADLVFNVDQKLESGFMAVDNFGTRYYGPQEFTFALEEDSFFRLGDSTMGQVVTTGNEDLDYAQIRHVEPIGYEGLRFGSFARFVRSEPKSILRLVDAKGKSKTGGIDLGYPIIRTRKFSLFTLGGFVVLDSKTDILGMPFYDDRIRPVFLTFNGNYQDELKGANTGELTFTQGLKILKASGDTNISRPNGKSKFLKLNASVSRLQSLPYNFFLWGIILGQYSFQSLLSVSQFGFGGPNIGRGYDPSEILGDRGVAASVELRYDMHSKSKVVPYGEFYWFYDYGKVWHTDPTIPHDTAASTGVGLRMNIGERGRANFFIAKPLTRIVLATLNKNIRGFFTITVLY